MIALWMGFLAFGALFVALVVSSVLREREVPTDGAIGRGGSRRMNRAGVLSVVLIVLLVLAAAVVIVRFQQIAIWE
ncbi:hypothetical protein [Rhodococcus sp. AW25M09]|uniref:hypothetical protein n=1 Tax=Rhodococcus sp. AW25M09 TaxID=1268303 RepID=UPI000346769A|nr:hypothetical protein [Rhodococcus sp. AW25M09]